MYRVVNTLYMHTYVNIHEYIHIYMYIYRYMHIHLHISIYIHIRLCIYINTYPHTYIHIHIHTQHTYVNICTHKYTGSSKAASPPTRMSVYERYFRSLFRGRGGAAEVSGFVRAWCQDNSWVIFGYVVCVCVCVCVYVAGRLPSLVFHASFAPPFALRSRGGGLGSRPIFKKFHETYAPS